MSKLKLLILETRPNFLILPIVLVILASAISYYYGTVNLLASGLALVGLLLLHISVNTLNEYFDYIWGVDQHTQRTPFSGGSGLLPAGKLAPSVALRLGIISFVLAVPVGGYFIFTRGWFLLPLFIAGAIIVLGYTPVLTKIGYGTAEISAGLGLGTLPVWGICLILNPQFSLPILYASIPSGFLVANLLFLNEFPDVEADKIAGRKTLPIQLGKRRAGFLYALTTSAVYIWLIIGAVIQLMPVSSLIALLTLPLAIKAIRIALTHKTNSELLPALGALSLIHI
ncbi:MAG: prenyltransferase, partial [Candidatus Sumerlaeia bacterium]|nr:prenyltransferase [Candidatus Sumerlaeia bacterium]